VVGYFWGLPPGGAHPESDPSLQAWAFREKVLVWGNRSLFAEIWGVRNFAFWRTLAYESLSSDFGFSDCVRQQHGRSNDPENFTKFSRVNFEQCAFKFGKNAL